jgi:ribosomal-protein-alanine N-acetyltransferase
MAKETKLARIIPPIRSRRIDLVSMSPEFIAAVLEGRRAEAETLLGVALPSDYPGERERTLKIRQEQLQQDPSTQPWLLRAIISRQPRELVGHINFHAPPDASGAVEVGYMVLPGHRRRGYATEAVEALFAWAYRQHGVRRFIASVSPDNAASLGVIAKLGFVQTGSQWDDEDGEELVFETCSWAPPG